MPPHFHGTIDTVSMQHLCRQPSIFVKKPKKAPQLGLRFIEEALQNEHLRIYLDIQGSLRDEWGKTCNRELIEAVITKWNDLKGIHVCDASGSITPLALSKKLKQHQFNDTCDKLIVRIGISAIDNHRVPLFLVVTNDGDFWDPGDDGMKGKVHAPVASALASRGIVSTLLSDFFTGLANLPQPKK